MSTAPADRVGQALRELVAATEEALAATGPEGAAIVEEMREADRRWEQDQREWLQNLAREAWSGR